MKSKGRYYNTSFAEHIKKGNINKNKLSLFLQAILRNNWQHFRNNDSF